MKEVSQKPLLTNCFVKAIQKEDVLLKKYVLYYYFTEDEDLMEMIKDLRKTSKEHMKILKDKMIALDIKN